MTLRAQSDRMSQITAIIGQPSPNITVAYDSVSPILYNPVFPAKFVISIYVHLATFAHAKMRTLWWGKFSEKLWQNRNQPAISYMVISCFAYQSNYIYAEYLWIIPRVTMTWCRPWRRSSCSSSIIWRRVLHIMEWWFPSTLLHLVIPAEDVLFLELHTIHLPLIIAHQLCGQFRGYSLEFCCSRPMLGKQTICRWITCRKSASSHLVQLIHLGALAVEDMRHDMTYEESIGIQRIHLSYPCLKQHIDQEFSADKRHFLSKCGVFERW